MRLLAVSRYVAPLLATCASTFALVKFDDGHDEIFVTGTAGLTYDSNIFAASDGDGDTSYNASLLLEYKRKAGFLGVDASLGWDFSKFSKFSSEDFANPQINAEITKDSGRTTGSLKASAKRENRADTAVNLRVRSWNYDTGVEVKYPVIQRYSLAGGLDYGRQDFADNTALVDINTYAAHADLFYALNSQRDLIASYRYRTTDTTADTTDVDHAFTVGVNGKIISKLNGSVRLGWQRRNIERVAGAHESHDSLTATGSTTWTISSRFNLTGTLSRDFSTVATDASVETTTAALDAQYAVNSKVSAFGGISYTHLRFLDTGSRGRVDDGLGFNAGVAYVKNDHLKFTAAYTFYKNWSSLALSDYDRHAVTLSVSSRW